MHVLLIPSWYPSAADPVSGVFFQEQAAALAHAEIKVGVISPSLISLKDLAGCRRTPFQKIQRSVEDGVRTYRLSCRNWSWRMTRLRMMHWLKLGEQLFDQYVSEQGIPDVIHAHCVFYGGILANRIKSRHRIPFVITEHSSAFARGLMSSYKKTLCVDAFKSADVNIAVSPSLASFLSTSYSSVAQPWVWVPNLLSRRFECLSSSESRQLGDEEKNSTEETKFRFLNIGIPTPNKGQDFLLRAFSSTFDSSSNVELIIGGDGPMSRELEEIVTKSELQTSVTLLGSLERHEVLREMLKADAFVLSSHYETFGIVLIESLACGKPVIATACGGPECIVTPENGLLIETGSKNEMSEALQYMRANVSQYNAFSIRQDCIANFGAASVIGRLRKIYSDVV